MRRLVPAILLLALGLSGCSQGSGDACPDDGLREEAFEDAQEFSEERLLVDVAATVRMEGTLEGEVGTFVLALDPEEQALSVDTPDLEVRVEGPDYSMDGEIEGETVSIHGRNHKPGAMYEALTEELVEGDDEPSFADDLTVDDYEATCRTLGGVDVVEYDYMEDGDRDRIVVERDGQHRPLSGEYVDPALQDNFRISISYEVPSVAVDTSLDRLPMTYAFDVVDSGQNARGGIHVSGRINDASEWVPLGDLEVQLVDTGDSSVYFAEELAEGVYDMGDGDVFTYEDEDGDGLMSEGDSFSMDLGPGLDVTFYDTWADAYVALGEVG